MFTPSASGPSVFGRKSIPTLELAEGVVDCLKVTLFQIEKELPKNKTLPLKLRLEIESALRPHGETLKRLGVEVAFSPFYQ